MKAHNFTRDFVKIMEGIGRRYDRHRVFLDWLTLASASFLEASSPWHREAARKDYRETAARYDAADMAEFPKLLGITCAALDDEFQDFLGHVFMSMEMGNKHQGQFFTPYELSKTIALLTIGTPDPAKELTTLQEPAVGSGGMIIACMEVFRSHGINYQTQTYTLAVDVSEMAARMAYIQFSILGIPAKVVLGNTITLETRAVWPTLFFGRVCHKLGRHRGDRLIDLLSAPPAPVDVQPIPLDLACAAPDVPPAPNLRPAFPEQLQLF